MKISRGGMVGEGGWGRGGGIALITKKPARTHGAGESVRVNQASCRQHAASYQKEKGIGDPHPVQ